MQPFLKSNAKKAILFGMGLAVDISGRNILTTNEVSQTIEQLATDFNKVGESIEYAILDEIPESTLQRILSDVQSTNAKQLNLAGI